MMETVSAIRRSALSIGIFAMVTAGIIAVTQVGTHARIVHNQQEARARALYEILPRSLDPKLHEHLIQVDGPLLGLHQPSDAWQAVVDGQVRAVILPAIAPDGYSGDIRLLVGINADGSVAGVRALDHKETPGLGDRIDLSKSNWIDGFVGQVMNGADDPQWAVKKDGGRFDQFTGATITPRAVVNATGRAIQYFIANRATLLNSVSNGSDQP